MRLSLSLTTMRTSLPTDITDEIIDSVHDDRGTLLSCSITCRSWRARSQYHLFTFVNLDRFKKQPVKRLSAILTHSPRLAAYIRHVKLPVDLEYCHSFLSICPLPYVEELTLTAPGSPLHEWRAPVGNKHTFRLAKAFSNTRFITVTGIVLNDFATLLELLRAFPNLVHVHLEDILFGAFENMFRSYGARIPSLRSLTLERGAFCETWLHSCVYPLVQQLRRLEVHFKIYSDEDYDNGTSTVEATSMGVLAGRLSYTLEELDISAVSVNPAKDMIVAYCANVLPNPTLRHVRISLGPWLSIGRGSADETLAMILANMRNSCFDSHTRVDVVVRDYEAHALEWKAVQKELDLAPLPFQFTLNAPGLIYNAEAAPEVARFLSL